MIQNYLMQGEAIVSMSNTGCTYVVATNMRVLVSGGRRPGVWREFVGLNAAGYPMQDGFHDQENDTWYGPGENLPVKPKKGAA